MAKRLPPIPKTVHTAMGEVKVEQVKKVDKEDSLGEYNIDLRVIRVKKGLEKVQKHQTVFHEWVHVVLTDAGVADVLDSSQEEAVCNAIATARVNELLARLENPLTRNKENE